MDNRHVNIPKMEMGAAEQLCILSFTSNLKVNVDRNPYKYALQLIASHKYIKMNALQLGKKTNSFSR